VEKHRRSLAKAISWRATGTVDTFVISFLLSGSAKLAGGIASVEVVTKMVLYYFHERVWSGIGWGRKEPVDVKQPVAGELVPLPQEVSVAERA